MGMLEVFSPLFYDSVMSEKLFYEIFYSWIQAIVLLNVTVDFEVILWSSWSHVCTVVILSNPEDCLFQYGPMSFEPSPL